MRVDGAAGYPRSVNLDAGIARALKTSAAGLAVADEALRALDPAASDAVHRQRAEVYVLARAEHHRNIVRAEAQLDVEQVRDLAGLDRER